jgi:hypothetical protein
VHFWGSEDRTQDCQDLLDIYLLLQGSWQQGHIESDL